MILILIFFLIKMILVVAIIIIFFLFLLGGEENYTFTVSENKSGKCLLKDKCGENFELVKGSFLPEYGISIKNTIYNDISLNYFRKSYINVSLASCAYCLGILTYKYLKDLNKNNPVFIFCQSSFIPQLVKEMGFKKITFFSKKKIDFPYVDHFPAKKELNKKKVILLNYNIIAPPKNVNSQFEHAGRINRAYACFLNKTLEPEFSLHLMYGTVFPIKEFIPKGDFLILPFAYPGRLPFFVVKGTKEVVKEDILDISIRVKIFDICQRNLNYGNEKFVNYDFYQLNINVPKYLREKLFFEEKNFDCSNIHSYLDKESGYYTALHQDKYFDFLEIPEIYIVENHLIAFPNKTSGDFIKFLGEKINYRCVWCDSLARAEIMHEAYPYLFIKTFNNLPDKDYIIKYETGFFLEDVDFLDFRSTVNSKSIIDGLNKSLAFVDKAEQTEYLKKQLIGKYDLIWIG